MKGRQVERTKERQHEGREEDNNDHCNLYNNDNNNTQQQHPTTTTATATTTTSAMTTTTPLFIRSFVIRLVVCSSFVRSYVRVSE